MWQQLSLHTNMTPLTSTHFNIYKCTLDDNEELFKVGFATEQDAKLAIDNPTKPEFILVESVLDFNHPSMLVSGKYGLLTSLPPSSVYGE